MSVNINRKNSTKRLHRAVIAATLWAVSNQATALSLSEIDLHSGLHQPFKASIKLRNFDPIEMDRVSVEIANDLIQSHYNSSNYLPNKLNAVIKNSSRGTVIELTSPTAVDEPFLKFAVQLNSPDGLILRQYEVLLDPPKNLYTPAPAPVVRQQIAKQAEPAAVKELKESLKLSAKHRNSGIEIPSDIKTAALIKAPTKTETPVEAPVIEKLDPVTTIAPAIRSAFSAPAPQTAEEELPAVAALIDATQPQALPQVQRPTVYEASANPASKSEELLYSSTEMSEEDFISALEEYSLATLLTPQKKPQVVAQKVTVDDGLQVDPTISTFKPETAALMVNPEEAKTPAANATKRDPSGIPAAVTIGKVSTRFAVTDGDFASSDADSVARALMQYRELARAGKKTNFHPSELVKMSANGVKRLQTPSN